MSAHPKTGFRLKVCVQPPGGSIVTVTIPVSPHDGGVTFLAIEKALWMSCREKAKEMRAEEAVADSHYGVRMYGKETAPQWKRRELHQRTAALNYVLRQLRGAA